MITRTPGGASFLPFLVAVETDPLRYHGEHPVNPQPLETAETEQLLARIATDLSTLFPDLSRHSLCLCGALYDATQILRPGWPVFRGLRMVASKRLENTASASSLVSVGASDGHLPRKVLVPDPEIPPGILKLIPCMLTGDDEALVALESGMEHRFMEEGQLSPLSARALEHQFSIGCQHARFMTLTDLLAMLKMQLEHVEFEGLWNLLDAALNDTDETRTVIANAGQRFSWTGSSVRCHFETFDFWARAGAGKDQQADNLAAAYAAWTREYRQYLLTLGAHHIPLEQVADGGDEPLPGSWFETQPQDTRDQTPRITEQGAQELGLVAVTVSREGNLSHFYPLAPEGLNDIHDHIAGLAMEGAELSYPGELCVNSIDRRLMADCT